MNDVHLYLPYFNSDTVKEVVEELQNAEGGDIPADIYGESLDTRVMDTLSVRPRSSASGGTRHTPAYPGQMSMFDLPGGTQPMELHDGGATPYGQWRTDRNCFRRSRSVILQHRYKGYTSGKPAASSTCTE